MVIKYRVKKRERDLRREKKLHELEERLTPLPCVAKDHMKSISSEGKKNA